MIEIIHSATASYPPPVLSWRVAAVIDRAVLRLVIDPVLHDCGISGIGPACCEACS